MPRYVALLRGVYPQLVKMPDLRRCFEAAGFEDVRTVLASGNVAFDAPGRSPRAIERGIEAALDRRLGRSFLTLVRTRDALRALVESDPHADFRLPANAKRIVTFLAAAPARAAKLPRVEEGVHVLAVLGREAILAYEPHPRGPVFMRVIEKTFGDAVTTRTWDTVKRCALA